MDRVLEWLKTGTCFPITIEIDPTNRCTRNCPACAGNRFCEGELSLGFMKKIIREIKPFCRGLIFTGGGEPLLNKNTVAAIDFAKKNGIDVGLVTNGDLMDKEIAKKLVKSCAYIRVSFNDDSVWEKVKIIVDERNKEKSKCTIGVGMLTNRKRGSRMKNFAAKARELKADYAQFRPYHLDIFDARKVIEQLRNEFNAKKFKVIASDYKYENMAQRKKKIKKYEISFADNFRTVIAADGKVYPDCWTRGMRDFALGDLRKDSFAKIWKSKRRKEILKSKLTMKKCPPMCYHDPLCELLWNVWQQNKKGEHLNFV